jgi:hypothetical protein
MPGYLWVKGRASPSHEVRRCRLKRNDVAPIIALNIDIKAHAWGSGRADHWDDRQCEYVV